MTFDASVVEASPDEAFVELNRIRETLGFGHLIGTNWSSVSFVQLVEYRAGIALRIDAENELLNHRMTWFLTLQGLLVASVGMAWSDSSWFGLAGFALIPGVLGLVSSWYSWHTIDLALRAIAELWIASEAATALALSMSSDAKMRGGLLLPVMGRRSPFAAITSGSFGHLQQFMKWAGLEKMEKLSLGREDKIPTGHRASFRSRLSSWRALPFMSGVVWLAVLLVSGALLLVLLVSWVVNTFGTVR